MSVTTYNEFGEPQCPLCGGNPEPDERDADLDLQGRGMYYFVCMNCHKPYTVYSDGYEKQEP